MEAERARFNSSLLETKESMSLTTTDKIEKSKEDLLNKIKDLERVFLILTHQCLIVVNFMLCFVILI